MNRRRSARAALLAVLLAATAGAGYVLGRGSGGLAGPGVRVTASADSIYVAGRAALASGRHREAAELFRRLYGDFPSSPLAPDAPYWAALAAYGAGSREDLKAALAFLRIQRQRYPAAQTRANARALEARIGGVLARGQGSASGGAGIPSRRDLCDGGDADPAFERLTPLLDVDSARAGAVLREVVGDARCRPEVRRKAVMLAAQRPEMPAAAAVIHAAQADPDEEVRAEAAFWLGALPGTDALTVLDSLARRASSEAQREGAVQGLARMHTQASRAVLAGLLTDAGVPEGLKVEALRAITGFDPGPAEAGMLRQMYPSLTPRLQREAIQAMGHVEDPSTAEWLLRLGVDPATDPELAGEAIYWSSRAGTPLKALLPLYERLTDRPRRERLLHAMSQREEPAAAALLRRAALSDPDAALRRLASVWLRERVEPGERRQR